MATRHSLKPLRQYIDSAAAPKLTPTARMVILTLSASAAPLTLGKLCDLTGTTPATLSRILPELVAAKIVNGKRIGLLIHYSLAPSPSTPAVGVEEEL